MISNEPILAQGGPLTGSGGGIIAFVSDRDGSHEIYLMNADGTAQTRVTNDNGFEFSLSWSPDGQRLAFISSLHSGFELYVMDVVDISNGIFSSPLRLTNNSVMDMFPSWSPDGLKIVFYSGGKGIVIINADGSNETIVNTSPVVGGQPSWSPTENIIAFTGQLSSNDNIYTINTNSTNLQQITFHNVDLVPAWSPDGTEIAYVTTNNMAEDVYIINADGSNDRRITTSPENDFVPSWAPEGNRLVYEGSVNGIDQICVIDTNGSNYQQLTFQGTNTGPCWHPISGISNKSNNYGTNIAPLDFKLFQNYPNPFNPSTTIEYYIPKYSKVELKIYNTLGQEVRTLVNEFQTSGNKVIIWDGLDNFNQVIPSGVYYYKIQVNNLSKNGKMMYVK
jgi:TolB protein